MIPRNYMEKARHKVCFYNLSNGKKETRKILNIPWPASLVKLVNFRPNERNSISKIKDDI